jgi:hypothetical protein
MRSACLLLFVLVAGVFVSGCQGGVSDSDKNKSATKFKEMNKNDVNKLATP